MESNTGITGRRQRLMLLVAGVVAPTTYIEAFPVSRSMISQRRHGASIVLSESGGRFSLPDADDGDDGEPSYDFIMNRPESRRAAINSLVSTLVGVAVLQQTSTVANAYEKTFPSDLDFENGDTSKNISTLREAKIADKKASTKKSNDPLSFRGPKDLLTFSAWGGALWLLSGSRSNPLVTPLANVFYNDKNEQWLKDRNEGLFASFPPLLFGVLGLIFFFLGVLADRGIMVATQGDANYSLQLACVSLISGAALELGRIASGEKQQTRQDYDRDTRLKEEFSEFAENRLKPGGNCHRQEVVKAFRRYYGKYRQADSEEYSLADIEIERLLRDWNRKRGNQDMSSAGFFTGIQINDQADVFVQRS